MRERSMSTVLHAATAWAGAHRLLAVIAGLAALSVIAVATNAAVGTGSRGLSSSDDAFGKRDASDAVMTAPSASPGFAAEESAFASGGGASDGSPGAGPPPLPGADLFGRTVIRSGSVDLEVESVDAAYEQVRQVATAAGGFVAESSFTGGEEPDQQRAYLTIRVPAEVFGDTVARLREIAITVRAVSTSAQDVTEEFTDLEATLRNLRAVESQYIELLGRANQIGEILQVQDRLNQVRLEIDRTQARIQVLESLSSMATITVSLAPPNALAVEPASEDGFTGSVRDAWEASLDSIVAVATIGAVAVVYSWWLVPIAVVAALLLRRAWRTRPGEEGAP